MSERRPGPDQLLRLGRMLEQSGDPVSAVVAYREVILAGEEASSAEARRRLQHIVLRAWPGRPA